MADNVRRPVFNEPPRVEFMLRGVASDGRLIFDGQRGGRLITPTRAGVDDELRIELHDDSGQRVAHGLARVIGSDPAGMKITFVSLGLDDALLALLAGREPAKAGPPKLPGVVGGPPPLRLDRPPTPKQSLPTIDFDAPSPSMPPMDVGDDMDIVDVGAKQAPLAVRKTGVIIGIDLGTTNTCASYVDNGQAKIIPGRTGTNTIPSMITFEPDGTFHIGQRAADRQVLYPLRTVYGSKRLIGRTYRTELAAELQAHFAYPLDEAEGQRFGARIDGRVISMDTIAARVLDEVRSTAEDYLKRPVDAAVITVPAYFSEVQREAVRRAASQAKLTVHRIVNEPTAAAVAYGHKQKAKARIGVWDFGGGTFDFSIVDVSDGHLEVVATGGDNFVGGSDFDDALASELLAVFQRQEKITIDPEPQQIARLRAAAEHAKRMLSEETEHLVELPEFTRNPKRNLRVEVTRARFDQLGQSLIDRTLAIANEVMKSAKLTPKDIDDVVLVGGTSRIPAVQASVHKLFGKRPSKRINPDEAVAIGAALLADEVGTSPTLLDVIPMSVGTGAAGRLFEPIVARHTRVPVRREMTLDADVLGTVYMPLFQGESNDVGRNEYLGTILVEDRSLWDRGRVRLVLSFDEHCVMSVEAINAKTGIPLPVQLDRSRPVEEVLRDLGKFEGEQEPKDYRPPETALGKVLGKLFRIFGR